MALTEEQQERIRKNRERALAIQQQRKKEQEEKDRATNERESNNTPNSAGKKRSLDDTGGFQSSPSKREKTTATPAAKKEEEEDYEDDLEPFEEGASELVTKGDAKKLYCLPEGTLEVCQVVEKDNPRHKSWSKMKLYYRKEIRRRAHKRFGGREGLAAERKRREDERFLRDMEKTKNIFKKK